MKDHASVRGEARAAYGVGVVVVVEAVPIFARDVYGSRVE